MHAVTAIHHLQQENVHTHVSIYQRRQTRNDLHNSERNKVHQAKEEEQIYARARDAGRERESGGKGSCVALPFPV